MSMFVEVSNQGRYVLDEGLRLVYDGGDQQVFRSVCDDTLFLLSGGALEAIDRDEADDVMMEIAGVRLLDS